MTGAGLAASSAATNGAARPLGRARITASTPLAATASASRLSYCRSPWNSGRGSAATPVISSAPVWPRAPTMPRVKVESFMRDGPGGTAGGASRPAIPRR
ncbi:hypothetical protein G6F68_018457 [Rhizopus microsporus]|nr:hypothetical protein G6F68_018457 [Rhizopus microsporus]